MARPPRLAWMALFKVLIGRNEMAYAWETWSVWWIREQIKATFGNYHNWARFCAIADRLEMEAWLARL